MPPPLRPPIGLLLSRAARSVSRAFDDALGQAGGSLPAWLVLISLKTRRLRNQRELAEAVGIREATLTHHLNVMDAQGLLTRRRDPANRRVHLVELTEAGEAAFHRLRGAAAEFDQRLRRGISNAEIATLEDLLQRLAHNAAGDGSPGAKLRRPPSCPRPRRTRRSQQSGRPWPKPAGSSNTASLPLAHRGPAEIRYGASHKRGATRREARQWQERRCG